MKKLILIAAVTGLSMVSCKKDRVCSCTYSKTTTSNGISVAQTSNFEVVYVKETKRISKLSCVHTKTTENKTNSTVVRETNCVLK